MMEPDNLPPPAPQPEIEQGVGYGQVGAFPTSSTPLPVSWMQVISLAVSTLLTGVVTWGAIILKRKRPKSGAEDAVYEVNRATIEDQRAQIEALQKENDALRTARNDFEAANVRAQANLEIARAAAETASQAARSNAAELVGLRAKWEQAQRYIFMLRAELAKHNIPIPPEPASS